MALGGLLGGKDSSVDIRTLPRFNAGQQALFDEQLIPFLTGKSGAPRERTGLEGLSLQAIEDFVQNQLNPQATKATDTIRSELDRGPTDFEDFFKRTVQDPSLEAFREDILPGISRNFSGSFFGSERRDADQRAQEELIDSLTRSRADLAFRTEEADRDRALRAAGLLPQVEGQNIANLFSGIKAENFTEQQQIDNILRALGLQSQENIATVDQGGGGLLQGLDLSSLMGILKKVGIGAGGALAGAAGGFTSGAVTGAAGAAAL